MERTAAAASLILLLSHVYIRTIYPLSTSSWFTMREAAWEWGYGNLCTFTCTCVCKTSGLVTWLSRSCHMLFPFSCLHPSSPILHPLPHAVCGIHAAVGASVLMLRDKKEDDVTIFMVYTLGVHAGTLLGCVSSSPVRQSFSVTQHQSWVIGHFVTSPMLILFGEMSLWSCHCERGALVIKFYYYL